uniref:(northern house mosquito) hypothetical protein n=1 Tax=Culex pipiens TaxID=7175 RepID=A0A8D8BEJ5_CULPI
MSMVRLVGWNGRVVQIVVSFVVSVDARNGEFLGGFERDLIPPNFPDPSPTVLITQEEAAITGSGATRGVHIVPTLRFTQSGELRADLGLHVALLEGGHVLSTI